MREVFGSLLKMAAGQPNLSAVRAVPISRDFIAEGSPAIGKDERRNMVEPRRLSSVKNRSPFY